MLGADYAQRRACRIGRPVSHLTESEHRCCEEVRDMTVGEICNREVVIMSRRESLLDAARLMREQHVGDVVLVDEKAGKRIPVGIISDRDVVVEALAREIPLEAITVGDVMSNRLLIAQEDDGFLETIKRMRTRGVRRVPVVDETGVLVGILTLDDFLEIVSEQLADLVGLLTTELRHERELRSD
jgi:CBS domain-containing protein